MGTFTPLVMSLNGSFGTEAVVTIQWRMLLDQEENNMFFDEINWPFLPGSRSMYNHVSIENDPTVSEGLSKII